VGRSPGTVPHPDDATRADLTPDAFARPEMPDVMEYEERSAGALAARDER
jgi:hypothetical protein